MLLLDNITNDPKQIMRLVVSGYETAEFYIEYKPNQYGWFFTLTWQDFTVTNQRITASPNFLRQYKKILPFGLLCSTNNNTDPLTQDSFLTNCKIYYLDSDDVDETELVIYGV